MIQDEESSGYDSFDGAPATTNNDCSGQMSSLLNQTYSGPDVDTHNSYAAVLNCPGDTHQKHMFDGVELREKRSTTRVRPRSEIVTSSVTSGPGTRPVSDSDMSKLNLDKEVVVEQEMLVIGGREVGQVNMFQRNISVWKLQL